MIVRLNKNVIFFFFGFSITTYTLIYTLYSLLEYIQKFKDKTSDKIIV